MKNQFHFTFNNIKSQFKKATDCGYAMTKCKECPKYKKM